MGNKNSYVEPVVDLNKYAGTWHQISANPAWFQRDCSQVTATYNLNLDKGRIQVLNTCEHVHHPRHEIKEGVARVGPKATVDEGIVRPAKLQVKFVPFQPWGDYWIVALDKDYQWSVVSEPSQRYMWILCRSETMDTNLYNQIIKTLNDRGYNTSRLEK
jgi:apolipoprotein D and lipocalin family protein